MVFKRSFDITIHEKGIQLILEIGQKLNIKEIVNHISKFIGVKFEITKQSLV
jgi:hypothetical protein